MAVRPESCLARFVLSWPAQPPPWYCRQYRAQPHTRENTLHCNTPSCSLVKPAQTHTQDWAARFACLFSVLSPPRQSLRNSQLKFTISEARSGWSVWRESQCPRVQVSGLSILWLLEPGVRRSSHWAPSAGWQYEEWWNSAWYCWYWSGGRYSHWAAEGDVWQDREEHWWNTTTSLLSSSETWQTGTILQADRESWPLLWNVSIWMF